MAQFKIAKVRIKELPSKFGGTWKLAEVKLEGRTETFELQGYGSKFVEKVKAGDTVKGYEGTKTFNGNTTPTINKITAEYLYDIMIANGMTMAVPPKAAAPAAGGMDDGWDQPVPSGTEEPTADDQW